jgi:hypothetical protein
MKRTGKSQSLEMDVINKCIPALFVLLVLAAPANCLAQQKPAAETSRQWKFYFDKPITLDSLTKYVHSHSKVRFSFNSSKVKGDKMIYLKKGTYSIELLLEQIRKNTSLYYSMYNGYVIFQDNPPKQKADRPVAAKNNTTPSPHNVKIPGRHTPVAHSNRQRNTRLAAAKAEGSPGKKAPSTDTLKPVTHANPDSLTTVAAVDSITRVDTAIALVRPRVQDTTTGNFLVLPAMAGKEKERATNRSRSKTHGVTPDEETGWHLSSGRHLKGVIPADTSATHRRLLRDTTTGNTAADQAAAEKKKERGGGYRSRTRNYSGNRNEKTGLRWEYGLQWKAAMPLYRSGHYFTGPDNRSQPYNPLIPGVWLSGRFNDKHEVLLLLKPAEWYLYNNKECSGVSDLKIIGVDTLQVRTTNRVVKTGGLYAGLQYNYHISENWIIGAGIGYQSQGRALIHQQATRLIDSVQLYDSLFSAKNDTLTGKYLNASMITAKFEVAYSLGSVDVGASLLLPLTNAFTSQSTNQSRPLNVQVFVRWRIHRRHDE